MLRALGVLATALALVPTATTLASWTDSSAVTATAQARTLSVVPLTCTEKGVLGITSATVSWSPVTQPTTLTYSARILERPAIGLSVDANSSVTVSPGLLSGLLGQVVTLRVTGTLPGSSWESTSDQALRIGLAGTSVSCR